MYADDIILISPTKNGMETMLEKVASYLKTWKIQMNKSKTNNMVIETKKATNLKIDGQEIERVK